MADITLPGQYNEAREKQIENYLKLQRKPVESLKEKVKVQNEKIDYIQEANKKFVDLRNVTRALYNQENPFAERLAEVSDEKVMTVTPNRGATLGSYKVKVDQVADVDNFLSKSVKNDYKVKAGQYDFSVGDTKIKVKFNGGKLKDLAEYINRKSRNKIEAIVLNDTKNTQVISIKTNETGKDQKLNFLSPDAIKFGKELEIITDNKSFEIPIEKENLVAWSSSLDKQQFEILKKNEEKNTLVLGPKSQLSLLPKKPIKMNENYFIEMEVRLVKSKNHKDDKIDFQLESDKYNVRDIKIESIESEILDIKIPELEPENNYIFAENKAKNLILPLPEIDPKQFLDQTLKEGEKPAFVKYKAEIGQITESLDELKLKNENKDLDLELKNLVVYALDENGKKSFIAKNPISQAQNSILDLGGIKIERDKNTIDDLFDDVVLNIKKPSDEPVEINITPNKKLVKDYLLNFVVLYNQALQDMNILTGISKSSLGVDTKLTKSDLERSLEGAIFETPEDREKALKKLGTFQGDSNFNSIKNSLKQIVSSPYETRLGEEFSFLKQIGIAPGIGEGFSSSLSLNVLNGYLQVDETKLEKTIDTNIVEMEQLFGYDTTGDFIKDSGLAVRLEKFLKEFVTTNGILKNKINGIQNKVESDQKRIKNYEEQIKKDENKFRQDLFKIDNAYRNLESSKNMLKQYGLGGGG